MNDSNWKRDCELKTNLGGYFKVNSWELGVIREDASRTGTKLLLQKLRSVESSPTFTRLLLRPARDQPGSVRVWVQGGPSSRISVTSDES